MQAGHRPSQNPRNQLQEAGHHSLRGETIFSLELEFLNRCNINIHNIIFQESSLLFNSRLDLNLF